MPLDFPIGLAVDPTGARTPLVADSASLSLAGPFSSIANNPPRPRRLVLAAVCFMPCVFRSAVPLQVLPSVYASTAAGHNPVQHYTPNLRAAQHTPRSACANGRPPKEEAQAPDRLHHCPFRKHQSQATHPSPALPFLAADLPMLRASPIVVIAHECPALSF